eukprot:scaffold203762_cov15-Tisochrysis_lutea.AAC.1
MNSAAWFLVAGTIASNAAASSLPTSSSPAALSLIRAESMAARQLRLSCPGVSVGSAAGAVPNVSERHSRRTHR